MVIDHCLSQSVKEVPRRVVRGDAQLPLQLKSTDPGRMGRDKIGCPEPLLDRQVRTMHNSTRGRRSLSSAPLALEQIPPFVQPSRLRRAPRANEAIRPPRLSQVLSAGFVGCELATKLAYVLRIIRAPHAGIMSKPATGVNQVSISAGPKQWRACLPRSRTTSISLGMPRASGGSRASEGRA